MDFSAVAHDLRTPLNVMLGHMQLLATEHLTDTARRRLLVLEAQVHRMMRLLETCGEHDSPRIRLAPLDIGSLIQHVVSELDAVLVGQDLEVSSNIPAPLPFVSGDGDLLHRVLLNLLINSVESITRGGRVEIQARVAPGETPEAPIIQIEITDTGVGIPAHHIAHVFERGFTTKPVRESHGLGLSICREIVQQHRGDIRLASEPGSGTTVRLWLPVHC